MCVCVKHVGRIKRAHIPCVSSGAGTDLFIQPANAAMACCLKSTAVVCLFVVVAMSGFGSSIVVGFKRDMVWLRPLQGPCWVAFLDFGF